MSHPYNYSQRQKLSRAKSICEDIKQMIARFENKKFASKEDCMKGALNLIDAFKDMTGGY